MAYRIVGIDVHKKKLAVVVADVEFDDAYQFERRWFGSNPEQLQRLAEWLIEQRVEEGVMESTAQYWKPLWSALERYWKPSCQNREGAGKMSGTLHLAQALSNRGRRGRKKDFRDAERLVKRLVSQELILSFARYPTATVENTHTHKVSTDAGQSPSAESTGGPAGRSAYQIIQSGLGSVGGQCASYAACASGGRNRSGGASRLGPSALACHVGRVARRAGRLHRTQPGLPSARKIGTGRLAINRAADRPTGPGDREPAPRASGCGPTASGSPRFRGRFGATDHCRGGCQGSDLRFRQESGLVGRSMPGRRGERRREPQQTLAEGQPSNAPHSQSSCQCCSQDQRKHFRDRISPSGHAHGT